MLLAGAYLGFFLFLRYDTRDFEIFPRKDDSSIVMQLSRFTLRHLPDFGCLWNYFIGILFCFVCRFSCFWIVKMSLNCRDWLTVNWRNKQLRNYLIRWEFVSNCPMILGESIYRNFLSHGIASRKTKSVNAPISSRHDSAAVFLQHISPLFLRQFHIAVTFLIR